jgi:membrane protein
MRGWSEDNAASMAAALAFYTLFSLAPLLLVAISLAGLFVGRNEAQNALVSQLTLMVGEKAALGIETILDAAGTREGGAIHALIGMLTLFIGATTVFCELRSDLDRIWRCTTAKARGIGDMVRTRLVAFVMVMTVGALLMVSVAASALLAAVGAYWFASSEALAHALEFVTSFAVITLLFAMIYKLLPTARIQWSDVWVGAAVTSLLFWIGKFAIGLYVGKAAVGSTFGAAETLVVIIAWVYYCSLIFFLGAEFTREYALLHGSRRGEARLQERRRTPAVAANDDEIVERAKKIVTGADPLTTSGP